MPRTELSDIFGHPVGECTLMGQIGLINPCRKLLGRSPKPTDVQSGDRAVTSPVPPPHIGQVIAVSSLVFGRCSGASHSPTVRPWMPRSPSPRHRDDAPHRQSHCPIATGRSSPPLPWPLRLDKIRARTVAFLSLSISCSRCSTSLPAFPPPLRSVPSSRSCSLSLP
jgi:hypothetical protein